MNKELEVNSEFYVKSSQDENTIEVIENFEMTNDFKQLVCLPYFKDLHKVIFAYILGHVLTF